MITFLKVVFIACCLTFAVWAVATMQHRHTTGAPPQNEKVAHEWGVHV